MAPCGGGRSRSSQEASYYELIVGGGFGLMYFGAFSGICLYASYYPTPYPDEPPLPRIVYLFGGLFFGCVTLWIAGMICRDVCKKLRRCLGQSEDNSSRQDNDEEEEDREGCPICLENLDRGYGRVVVRLPYCVHRFHRDCIDKWLFVRPRCPTCRSLAVRNN